MIFAPPRTRGPLIATLLALAILLLGAVLIVHGATERVSFAAFLAYSAGAALLVGGLPLAYWAYAAVTLRYELRRGDLVVHWGLVQHVIPLLSVERVVLGRHLAVPAVRGLRLPGMAVGRATVNKLGPASVYFRYHGPEELLYLVGRDGSAVGLSLMDVQPFVQSVAQAKRSVADQAAAAPVLRRGALASLGFWSDRRAVALVLAALVPAWLASAVVYGRYQAKPGALLLHFPPTEVAHIAQRTQLLHIPESALAWFIGSAALVLLLFARHRPAAYTVLAGSAVAGTVLLVGALGATG